MGQVLLFERAFPRRRPGPRLANILRRSVGCATLENIPAAPVFAAKERKGSTPSHRQPLRPRTQKGPGIAARPRVAGLLPWTRTDLRHGFGGSSARAGKGMRASGRSSRLAVLHSPRRGAAVTSLGGPLRLSGRGPEVGSLAGCFSPLDPSMSFRIACALLPAGRSRGGPFPRPRSRALAHPFPRTGTSSLSVPSFSLRAALACRFPHPLRAALARRLPLRFPLRLRAAVHSRFARRLRVMLRFPVEPCSAVPRNLGSAWAALRFRNLQELRIPEPFPMRFPEGTCTVSSPCKLLILLRFPAAGPFCLQI